MYIHIYMSLSLTHTHEHTHTHTQGLLVWLPTSILVTMFNWLPSSRFLLVWVLLPIGGLCVVELASVSLRRVINRGNVFQFLFRTR